MYHPIEVLNILQQVRKPSYSIQHYDNLKDIITKAEQGKDSLHLLRPATIHLLRDVYSIQNVEHFISSYTFENLSEPITLILNRDQTEKTSKGIDMDINSLIYGLKSNCWGQLRVKKHLSRPNINEVVDVYSIPWEDSIGIQYFCYANQIHLNNKTDALQGEIDKRLGKINLPETKLILKQLTAAETYLE